MKRVDLLTKVETVARALAANDILPIMTHMCITGDDLIAHNGSIAISVPLKAPVSVCVPGDFFASMLKASGAKEVDVALDGDALLITGAATKIKLPTMPANAFSFKVPELPEKRLGCDGKQLSEAFRVCLRSVGLDATRPDQLGVTIMPSNSGGIVLYSTTGKTLTRATVSFEGKGVMPFEQRVVLPGPFCKNFVELYESGPIWCRLDSGGMIMSWGEGPKQVTMCCSFIQHDKPLPYRDVFKRYAADGGTFIPVASRLDNILARACIVAKGDIASIKTAIRVQEGTARFITRSKVGEVRDSMPLADGHADVTIEVDPVAFRAGCEDFTEMVITDVAVNMRNEFAVYLISSHD